MLRPRRRLYYGRARLAASATSAMNTLSAMTSMPNATTRHTGGQPLLELLLLCGLRFDAVSSPRSRADPPGERDAWIFRHLRRLHLRQVLQWFHASAAKGRRG
jgi:hypothetical protein